MELETGEQKIVLYADDGCKVGRNPIWVQKNLTSVVRIFDRLILQTNLGKTKAMVFTLVFIWGKHALAS